MWIKRVFVNPKFPLLLGSKKNLVRSLGSFTLPLRSARFKTRRLLLLLGIFLLVLVITVGCTGRGAPARGWSGGTIAGGSLFFGSMKGGIVALDKSTGTLLWNPFTLEAPKRSGGFGCTPAPTTVAIYGTPAVAGDLLYAGGYNGRVYALNASSGALRWVYPRDDFFKDKKNNIIPIVGGLATDLEKVYFGINDGTVYALDAVTGDIEWEFDETGDEVWSTPAVDGDTVFITSFDKKLYALNADDGRKKWEFETEGAIASTPVVYNNTIYFGSFDRYLYAVDAAAGTLKWKFMSENWFWAKPLVFNNRVYAGSLDGKVYVLDAGSGAQVAEFDLGSPVSSSPVLVDESVIIVSQEGKVSALGTADNQIRQVVDLEEKVFAPLYASEGVVYIHSDEDILHALDIQTGVIRWHYLPPK